MAAGRSGRDDPVSLRGLAIKTRQRYMSWPGYLAGTPSTSRSFFFCQARASGRVLANSCYCKLNRKAAAGDFPTHYLIDLNLE